jgi:hypothetical protein
MFPMNKAFVREPDATDEYCPRCGSKGMSVGEETLRVFLGPKLRSHLAQTASFCPMPRCEVAYFDALEQAVPVSALGTPIYPKDPAAAICPCFGLTCDDIDEDVREGVVTRTRAAVERARSAEAQCLVKSPTGRSCQAAVQAYYMKRRGGG